jgi:hypothetical protein
MDPPVMPGHRQRKCWLCRCWQDHWWHEHFSLSRDAEHFSLCSGASERYLRLSFLALFCSCPGYDLQRYLHGNMRLCGEGMRNYFIKFHGPFKKQRVAFRLQIRKIKSICARLYVEFNTDGTQLQIHQISFISYFSCAFDDYMIQFTISRPKACNVGNNRILQYPTHFAKSMHLAEQKYRDAVQAIMFVKAQIAQVISKNWMPESS